MDQSTKFIIIMASITLLGIILSHFVFKYYYSKKLRKFEKQVNEREIIFQNDIRPVLAQWRIDRDSRKAIDALSEALTKVEDPSLRDAINFIIEPLLQDELVARTGKDY